MSETDETRSNVESNGGADNELPKTCEVVTGCTIPVDIFIQSSDEKLFGAHTQNLQAFSEGFPMTHDSRKVVWFTESATILRLFLPFTHNVKPKDLSTLSVDQLVSLAEVADKYKNQFALLACRKAFSHIAGKSSENAMKILRFKSVHGDFEEIDDVARLTMGFTVKNAMKVFGQNRESFCIWVQYQESWLKCMEEYRVAVSEHPDFRVHPTGYKESISCPSLANIVTAMEPVVKHLGLRSVDDFERALRIARSSPTVHPGCNCRALGLWRASIHKSLAGLPRWSQFS
ncbi:hypothetical protein E1B28_013119 [Marasmius oreades]|uniref:BTB domain-containing protein n=1 Tax=Marasmius oreades TaxID=181124 RepID=A0A9P7UPK0_9AGAR|nr:uncharacterized protein E1B28_013119 [Marasmius oreades]KAG7087139.1 hypothetical protein E1B28_013119 [Marasmius oreades]